MMQTNARPVTKDDHELGYAICGCGKFAHVFKAATLQRLPKGYNGELCQECSCWMVAIEKLTPNVELTGAARLYRAASSDRRERG